MTDVDNLQQDKFSLERPTFVSKWGNVLTVIGYDHSKKSGNNKKYAVTCNNCRDEVFYSRKDHLKKSLTPCRCSPKKSLGKCPTTGLALDTYCGTKIDMDKCIYTVLGWSEKKGSAKKYVYSCSVCSQDKELFPLGSISGVKSHIMEGKLCCGCSVNPRWTQEQREIQIKRELSKCSGSWVGWSDGYTGAKGKFKWVCDKGHSCETGVNHFLNGGKRCKTCAILNNPQLYGYYPERVDELDYLYIFKIKNTNYFKVGRTFDKDRRLGENQKRVNSHYNDTSHEIYDTLYFKGTHQEVFDLEQKLIGFDDSVFDDYRPEDHYGSSELILLEKYEECLGIIENTLDKIN